MEFNLRVNTPSVPFVRRVRTVHNHRLRQMLRKALIRGLLLTKHLRRTSIYTVYAAEEREKVQRSRLNYRVCVRF